MPVVQLKISKCINISNNVLQGKIMSYFRKELEFKGDALLETINSKVNNSFKVLPFKHYGETESLINEWKDFIGKEHRNISVRADLTFKRSRRVFLPSIGSCDETHIIHKITEGDAVLNIASFCNRLNYACYKHAFKRYGKKLEVISCIEGGRKSLRETTPNNDSIKELHAHLLLERPKHINYDDFELLIIKLWMQTEWGNIQHYIQPIKNLYASAKYNVKSSLDSLDLTNTHLRKQGAVQLH